MYSIWLKNFRPVTKWENVTHNQKENQVIEIVLDIILMMELIVIQALDYEKPHQDFSVIPKFQILNCIWYIDEFWIVSL